MIFAYIFLCVFGSVVGATVYMLYQSCTILISGNYLSLFSYTLFLAGLLKSFPVCVMLTSLFIPLYCVRHPDTNIVASFAVYLALSFISWGIILPLNALYGLKQRESGSYLKKTYDLPSAGYFRSDDKYITYYTKVSSDGKATGIQITKDTSVDLSQKVAAFADKEIKSADSIIKEVIAMPPIVQYFVLAVQILENRAVDSVRGGILPWLCFSAIGAALFSVFQLRFLSSHKLVNCVVISFLSPQKR